MKFLIFILAFLSLGVLGYCQPSLAPLDNYLKRIYGNHIIPGFSVVVVKGDQVVFSKGFGVESMGGNKLFTPATNIAVGSLTKSFTALAAMKLVEKGKLDLDAPVIGYLPWFRTANKELSDKITVKMLLDNTSGLYPSNESPCFDLSDAALEGFVKNLASVYLLQEPGNSFEYSNAGFVVAGLIISKVSGVSFPLFVETEILRPLGMKHTFFITPKDRMEDISYGHYPAVKSVIMASREPDFETGEYMPAGSLLQSNGNDIGKYLLALLNDHEWLRGQTKRQLWASHISFQGLSVEDGGDGSPIHYGLGWMISNIEGRQIFHHGGSTGKTSTFTMIDTANKMAASILMNYDITFIDKYSYPTELTILNNVMRLALQLPVSNFGKPVIKDPTANDFELKGDDLLPYIGEYKFVKGGDTWVYFGVDLKIQKTTAGALEGIIYRERQVVNRFTLDFINPALALSRNVNLPGHLTFKISSSGKVTAAFFNNIEFVKSDMPGNNRFRELKAVYGLVSFSIPLEWAFNPGKKGFSAYSPNKKISLSGSVMLRGNFSFDSVLKSNLGKEIEVMDTSKTLSQTIGILTWKQKMYLFKSGKKTCYGIITFAKNSQHLFWFLLISPDTAFSPCIQEVLNPLMKSFRVK